MKRKRFSVEQIVAIVKQAEMGMPVAELIRRVGISEQTFYRWKKQFTGLEIDQVRQLKQLGECLRCCSVITAASLAARSWIYGLITIR